MHNLSDKLKVFGTHQTISVGPAGAFLPPMITDHTQAVIQKMTSMRIEAAIAEQVMMSTLTDMAARMNERGRGLLADRMDLAADGVSHLAMMGWTGMRFTSGRNPQVEEATMVARDLWNGDEGVMH